MKFDENLGGMVWNGENLLSRRLLVPNHDPLRLRDWQNFWAERNARVANLSEIYAAIINGAIEKPILQDPIITNTQINYSPDLSTALVCHELHHAERVAVPENILELAEFVENYQPLARTLFGMKSEKETSFSRVCESLQGFTDFFSEVNKKPMIGVTFLSRTNPLLTLDKIATIWPKSEKTCYIDFTQNERDLWGTTYGVSL